MSKRGDPRSRRPDSRGKPGGRPGARRPPPPESTGLEARYFAERGESGTPVRVVMLDGGSVEGIVRGSDREMLVVEPEIGDAIRVRKSGIRYIEESAGQEG